ncbi:hypothetical protein PHMEG_00018343 [Phytophthora megakarya]|uniref:ATP-binding cassette (ABC) Superfamily n=1 Tax=Phytophthora megakarya TaxID=4795 RepID=A0A225VWT4_9STRA|nr:hypothetical protein PHMEG_00018343 [Phytophthora megakarya]
MEAKHLPSKKRSASQSPRHSSAGDGSSRHLFSSSSDEEKEAAVFNPFEVTNDLDHQQEQALAARAQERHTPAHTVPTPAVAHQLGGEPTYPRGYFPPDVSSGDQLFLERLESHRRPFQILQGRLRTRPGPNPGLFLDRHGCGQEFTSLRKKPEASGELHPVWGYPWVQPEHTSTKWVSIKGYSAQKLQELRDEKTLSNILVQRDLRIQFAHLISKRQLSKEIARPTRYIRSCAHDERRYGAFVSASVPSNTAKKPRVTYEAAAASAP